MLAVQVGTPFRRARTLPAVPEVVVESCPVPLPKGMVPDWMAAQPVPPFGTVRTPVTSEARLIREVATAPAVALRKPLTLEKVKEFEATSSDVEARLETESEVEVASVNKPLVNVPRAEKKL